MKFTALALAGVASALETSMHFKFMNYIVEHGKSYLTAEEFGERFELFKQAEEFVRAHNLTTSSYTLRHNQFSDRSEQEKAMTRGRIPTETKEATFFATNAETPESVDWRDAGAVTPVKDQGQCGSCWAFSSTGCMEGAVAVKYGTLLSFSEQFLVDCVTADFGCGGGLQVDALAYLVDHEMILESDYAYTASGYGTGSACKYDSKPHTSYHTESSGYVQVEANSVQAMKEAVAQAPLAVAIEADRLSFQLYSGGIFDNTGCGTTLDHAVLVVGYGSEGGQEYWIVKNSWGSSWGEEGYIRLAITGDGAGICGVQQDTQLADLS